MKTSEGGRGRVGVRESGREHDICRVRGCVGVRGRGLRGYTADHNTISRANGLRSLPGEQTKHMRKSTLMELERG